ncbi:MAG: hypothetical protein ABIJ97_17580 [Bacteroidota bacterium]
MKKILVLITIASLALMITFSGCKKEEEVLDLTLPTATIKGKVWADLNLANDTTSSGWYKYNPEFAPSGTKIIAVINSVDLVDAPAAGYTYQDLTYEGSVNATGDYTITIPARGTDVNVTIKAVDFTYDQITMDIYPATKTEREIFTVGDQVTTVVANQIRVIDFAY